jgi:hypothetical protein
MNELARPCLKNNVSDLAKTLATFANNGFSDELL